MSTVELAGAEDIDRLVVLQADLFRDDAGVHDRLTDLTWPEREGRRDFEALLADGSSVVLAARAGSDVVGFLVGYENRLSATRLAGSYAVLRSLYVAPSHRRAGIAGMLVERFVSWARERGCLTADVDSYTANEPAQRLYERHGFLSRTVTRVLEL